MYRRLLVSATLAGWCGVGFLCPMARAVPQDVIAIRDVKVHTQAQGGVLEKGTVVIRDGKIAEVGENVAIPIAAKVIDGRGKSLTPSFIAVFRPIDLQQASEGETRTVTVRGRSFPVSGRSPATNTSFQKVSDAFSLDALDWRAATRSGVTVMNLLAPGYSQSAVIKRGSDPYTSVVMEPNGQLLVTLTNSSQSLDLLRNNLKTNERGGGGSSGASAAAGGGGGRRGSGGPSQRREGGGTGASTPAASPSTTSTGSASEPTAEQKLWNEVREGNRTLWIAVNNSATILHALRVLSDYPKVKAAWIVSGTDAYQTIQEFPKERTQLVLNPRIDLVPNSRNRMNVPAMLKEAKVPFAFSLGSRQAELVEAQSAPTFALAILAKTGLGEEDALRAATLAPAKLIGMDAQMGSIETGKLANLILFDGSPFETTTSISQVFLEGKSVYEN